MGSGRGAVAACLLVVAAPVGALAEYPAREVDRPLVLPPGLTEVVAGGEYARASRAFDEDARTLALPEGAVLSATTATVSARYGVFQGLEVWVAAPYLVRLQAEDGEPVSGTGRASFGARYELRPRPETFLAGTAGIVLPSTARALRTAPDGTLHRDHLAVSGAIAFKQVLLDATAAYGSAEIVFPFANEDDDEVDRDPPATYRVSAGSLFDIEGPFFADAGVSFTRTNRDRVAGGLVPRSDQYRVDLRPAVGLQLFDELDLRASAAIPLAGKNTPQSLLFAVEARLRF